MWSRVFGEIHTVYWRDLAKYKVQETLIGIHLSLPSAKNLITTADLNQVAAFLNDSRCDQSTTKVLGHLFLWHHNVSMVITSLIDRLGIPEDNLYSLRDAIYGGKVVHGKIQLTGK